MNAEAPRRSTQARGPRKIGRYHIHKQIGSGGMGVVYRAEDRSIGRQVAVKTLTELTPELLERFYVEARSGIISHPNIVTVYELGEHEGCPFIAMEFIDGESLEQILKRRRKLPALEAAAIVEQLCAGLGYAHGHGVVHRDIKPANLLLRPDGRLTIVDFGIARLADRTHALTKVDTLLGTFHYIAPERLKGETGDGRADVWSAGVILYELLTGQLPFKGSPASAVYRVLHEPYEPVREHVPDIPEALSLVLERALSKNLESRYATAEEMAFDLQALAAGSGQDRAAELLETAGRLLEARDFSNARAVLLQAQRLNPNEGSTKALLSEAQEQLSRIQREEQARPPAESAPRPKRRKKEAAPDVVPDVVPGVVPGVEPVSGQTPEAGQSVSGKPRRARQPRQRAARKQQTPAVEAVPAGLAAAEELPEAGEHGLTRVLHVSREGEFGDGEAGHWSDLDERHELLADRTGRGAGEGLPLAAPVVPLAADVFTEQEGDKRGGDGSEAASGSAAGSALEFVPGSALPLPFVAAGTASVFAYRAERDREDGQRGSLPRAGRARLRWLPAAAVLLFGIPLLATEMLYARRDTAVTAKSVTKAAAPSGPVQPDSTPHEAASGHKPQAAAAAARASLLISAMPWATVIEVTNERGEALALPQDKVTPLRLEAVPAGEYRVRMASAGGVQKAIRCTASERGPLCSADFGAPDAARLLNAKRR